MSIPDCTNIRGPGARGFSNRGPGDLRGSGFPGLGNGGFRAGWRNSGAPYGRPSGDPLRGGNHRSRRPLAGGLPTKNNSLCSVCKTAEGRYKFRCCGRRFCSTSCYKSHAATPCTEAAEKQVLHQHTRQPTATDSSKAAQRNLPVSGTAEESVPLAEPTARGGCASPLLATQYNQQVPCADDAVDPSSAVVEPGALSAESETESGEASLDESDVSQSDKSATWRYPQPRRACQRKFESLSSSEEEIIRTLSVKPELQSTALRDAIRSVVTAASQGPRAGSAALSNLMQRPDFAAFANLLMDALDPEGDASNALQLSTLEQYATHSHVAQADSRPN